MAHDHPHHQTELDHPQAHHVTRCSCGQELDVCTRGHCPRCGHRLEHHTDHRAGRILVGI